MPSSPQKTSIDPSVDSISSHDCIFRHFMDLKQGMSPESATMQPTTSGQPTSAQGISSDESNPT